MPLDAAFQPPEPAKTVTVPSVSILTLHIPVPAPVPPAQVLNIVLLGLNAVSNVNTNISDDPG